MSHVSPLIRLVHHISSVVDCAVNYDPSIDHNETTNDIMDKVINKDPTRHPDIRKKINRYISSKTDKIVRVVKKPHPCARPNQCYLNAYMEYNITGNPIVYALIQGTPDLQDEFYWLCIHAFNYDVATNTYYDTTPQWKDETSFPAFIVDSKVAPQFKTTLITRAFNPKTYVFLTTNDRTYVMEAKEGWRNDGSIYDEIACVETI